MGYINHHHKEANEDSVENKNVSEAFYAFFEAVIMCIKVPSPNCTHNNRY